MISLSSPTRRRSRGAALAVAVATVLALVLGTGVASTAATRPTYRNAVSDAFSDTFADPSVILAKDGWWYAYSTADPLYSGDPSGTMHIARTRDWARWEYLGTVFDQKNRPAYATPTAGLWAPDIRYVGGQYVLYYTVTDTTLNDGEDPGIGVATAPDPAGPWTPQDTPIIAPRERPGTTSFLGTIDPAMFTDVTGQHYLYFGGYNGGFWATQLSADGLSAEPDYTEVAIDNRYEGGYVVRHDGWYYFMASSANCCAGPTTGYSLDTGRSRSPLGPFVDADGISLLASAVGGTSLITQNGNRWIGPGHNAMATDAEGRDYLVYHAIDRTDPWLNQPFGVNRRPMLIDRIDWIDGWPRTRAGAGPSDTAQPAPVTTSGLGIVAADPARSGWRGLSAGPTDAQAGATARLAGQARTVADAPRARVRIRMDLKGDRPVTMTLGRRADQVEVTVDPRHSRLVVNTLVDRKARTASTALPSVGSGWQSLVVEVDRATVLAQVGESDLSDPRAEVRLTSRGLDVAPAPVQLSGSRTLIDNVTVRGIAREATELVAVPQTGRRLASEEFSSEELTGWSWVREDAAVTVSDGRLRWPVEDADLVGDGSTSGGNDAGVLLHAAPSAGDWIAETKVKLDLGVDDVRNYQQAGIVAYRSDDDFARLSTVAIWNTRQTEFGRELPTADGRLSYGGSTIGTPSPTVWLRLAHHRSSAGEDQYRAGTSRDGKAWTWGAVWSFTPGVTPRIGLVAHGGSSPAVTASFDYVRFYASTWPSTS